MQNNDQTSFKIVLTGFPKPGISVQDAEQNLSKLLPIELAKIQLLLQGTPTTIKRNLTIENIERYRQALNKTGVEFEIVADIPEPLTTNVINDEISSASSKLPKCPKCGYQAKCIDDPLVNKHNGIGECPKCGIIPENYLKIQREQQNLHNERLEKRKKFVNLKTKISQILLMVKKSKKIKKIISRFSQKNNKKQIMVILISTILVVAISIFSILKLTNSTIYLIDSCLEAARKQISYKDPDSLRIESSAVYTEKNPRVVSLSINAKNSYGAYAGAKSIYCILEDKKITDVINDDEPNIASLIKLTDILKNINREKIE